MPTQEQIQKALQLGYTPQQIQLAIARANVGKPKEKSIGRKVVDFGVDILNTPSYILGGAMKTANEKGWRNTYLQDMLPGSAKAVYQGFTSDYAPTIYEQLPKALGLKEGSAGATVVGLGGELLTPGVPVSALLSGASKLTGIGQKLGKVTKGSGVIGDAGRTLIEKSYKLSRTNIDKIAEAIGATDESTKAIKVVDYLEGLGLKGANRESLSVLKGKILPVQETYNTLVKSGKSVPRSQYAKALLEQAVDLEKTSDDPGTRQLVEQLFKEAEFQMNKGGFITDTDIARTKTTAFSNASKKSINDPFSSSFDEQVGRTGVRMLEDIAPGSKAVGKELRGLRTVEEQIGRQANTGLGTQLVNAFKPSALGFGIGAGAGYSSGQNPLKTGLIGAAGISIASMPKTLNVAGKALSKGTSSPKLPGAVRNAASGFFNSAIRLPGVVSQQAPQQQQVSAQRQQESPYITPTLMRPQNVQPVKPSVRSASIKYKAPKNVFSNKSAFGKSFQLKAGSFN